MSFHFNTGRGSAFAVPFNLQRAVQNPGDLEETRTTLAVIDPKTIAPAGSTASAWIVAWATLATERAVDVGVYPDGLAIVPGGGE